MAMIMIFMGFCLLSSPALAVPTSSISAPPAFLPLNPPPPLSSPSPALSPDISPLFPSPGGLGLSPSESSLPIIPSSPSPPNPDDMAAAGPNMAFSPSEFLPESYSGTLSPVMVVLDLVAFWFLQLSGI